MEITVSEHRIDSELNLLVLGKTVYFQLRLQKEEPCKVQPSNCYEVCMLLAYLGKDQSNLVYPVEGKSVKCD